VSVGHSKLLVTSMVAHLNAAPRYFFNSVFFGASVYIYIYIYIYIYMYICFVSVFHLQNRDKIFE
jgi:hypothetical protein